MKDTQQLWGPFSTWWETKCVQDMFVVTWQRRRRSGMHVCSNMAAKVIRDASKKAIRDASLL
eukprot:1161886-Pelagomonas_calceolata.AAC.3